MSALTKILIVLQLVFAVAVSVLLVLMVSRQEDYRTTANNYRLSSLASAAQLQQSTNDLASKESQIRAANSRADASDAAAAKARQDAALRASNDQSQNLKLSGDVSAKDVQIASLTAANDTAMKSLAAKDKELETLRPQVSKGTSENAELARRNNELENQMRAAQQAIQKLQEQVVARNNSGATMNSAGSQVQMLTANSSAASGPAVNAKVGNVMQTSGRTLIELPLGTRDGIQPNTPVFVYRSTGYVADAIIERATADSSVAVITKTKEGQAVQTGDIVSTIAR